MLTLKLLPQVNGGSLSVSWADPVLTVNGIGYDLSLLADGEAAEHPVLITAYRDGGNYEVSLIYPIPENATQEQKFPSPINVNSDGQVI